MPKYSYSVDDNHAKIKRAFQLYGWNVIDTAGFSGKMLDLFIYRGNTFFFVEIKRKAPYHFTAAEMKFMTLHEDRCIAIRDVSQVEAITRKFK